MTRRTGGENIRILFPNKCGYTTFTRIRLSLGTDSK